MINRKLDGLSLIYEKEYTIEAKIIINNYKSIFERVRELWGLKKPKKIIIYIIKSDFKFVLLTHKLLHKILLVTLLLPYWFLIERNIRKKWRGVCHFQNKYPNILLKPMSVYERLNNSIGSIIYKSQKELKLNEKFKLTLCDQLVNITILPLFPMWLREGISSITIEKFINKQIYKDESIKLLKETYAEIDIRGFSKVDDSIIAYNYVKGYWTVRYLEENHPGFLKEAFKEYKGEDIVEHIRLKLGLNSEEFWEQLDELLYENYKYLLDK